MPAHVWSHDELRQCLSLVLDAVEGLDDERAAVRVDGKWSVAEVVEHLDRTYTGTTKGLARVLDTGVATGRPRSLRTRFWTWVVVRMGIFPRGIKAPAHVVPVGAMSLSALRAAVRAHLIELDEVAAKVRLRHGAVPVLAHPILGPFSVAEWLRFHVGHTRHHEKQVRRRRQRLDDAR